ncbi:butyrate kinase [Bacteroidota bacterium]
MEKIRILSINPGSTSTKIAVYEDSKAIFIKNIQHSTKELSGFNKATEQFKFRKEIILKELKFANIELDNIKAVVGRGGVIKPIESGVYEVNELLIHDLLNSEYSHHASNLGGLIANDIAISIPNARAFIADPVVVDEFEPMARITGHKYFERKSIFHALNQKAVGRTYASSIIKKYKDLNLIIAHLGGGISIGAHKKGKVIDVNQGLDGDGPFSPERSGTLPVGDLVKLCYSGKYTQKEVYKMIVGEGGMVSYFGTNNAVEIEVKAMNGDKEAVFIFNAMAYQIAKTIGEMYTVLKCEADAILITGGLAHNKFLINQIIERVFKLAPVHIFPGEDEMKSLGNNGLMVIKGEIQPKVYK